MTAWSKRSRTSLLYYSRETSTGALSLGQITTPNIDRASSFHTGAPSDEYAGREQLVPHGLPRRMEGKKVGILISAITIYFCWQWKVWGGRGGAERVAIIMRSERKVCNYTMGPVVKACQLLCHRVHFYPVEREWHNKLPPRVAMQGMVSCT